jgi:Fe-Mn family superoxide dismutase
MKLIDILYEQKQSTQLKRLPLSYKLSALEPHIDTATMQEHFGKHYKGYTDKFNDAIKDLKIKTKMHGHVEQAIDIVSRKHKKDAIRNNGGGYVNHALYFENMTPDYKAPSVKLKTMIEDAFGSMSEFKEQFKQAGLDQFGSGWAWLTQQSGKLKISSTANQENPYMDSAFSGKVLLAMDVWEHAYYLKHRSKRATYIDAFFRVIDWKVVEGRLE